MAFTKQGMEGEFFVASVVSLVPFQKVILEPTNLVRPFRIGSLAYAGAHWLRDVLELGGWRAAVVFIGPSPKFSFGKVPQPVVRCSGPGLTGRKGGVVQLWHRLDLRGQSGVRTEYLQVPDLSQIPLCWAR